MARDPLMGTPLAGQPMLRGMIWAVLGAILALALIAVGYFLFAPRSPTAEPVSNQVAAVATPTPVASETPLPEPSAAPIPEADFAITDALMAKELTVEQLRADTGAAKTLCLGKKLSIRNDTAASVTLLDTPEDSDDTIELGKVKAGAVFTFTPNEEGTYLVASQSGEGWLFVYTVSACGAARNE